jgi:phosphoserine phosphatase RsbU/P
MIPEASFTSAQCSIPAAGTLYVFSDGIYELNPAAQTIWGLEDWISLLTQADGQLDLDQILQQVQAANANHAFNDDVSLLKIQFGV